MKTERILVEWLASTRFEDLPSEPVEMVRQVVLTNLGTLIGGAAAEGCREIVDLVRGWGGQSEATILIYGGRVPVHNAAFVNSYMARALDFDDAAIPGIHIGASSVPTALGIAELIGGASGKQFLNAVVLGTEIAMRLNYPTGVHSICAYDGVDPVGVCTVFAAAAIAGKLLGLNEEQLLNALGLASQMGAGSWQSNVDGTLAIRVIQGRASQAGILAAQMAQEGISGPNNFIEGIFGYMNLHAKGLWNPAAITGELGKRWELMMTLFKVYPCCWVPAFSVSAILDIVRETSIKAEDIDRIIIKMPPLDYNMNGRAFNIGANARPSAQFNVPYCVASTLLRGKPQIEHFEKSFVGEPRTMELASRVECQADSTIMERGLHPIDMEVITKKGAAYTKSVNVVRGTPPDYPLSSEEIMENFLACIDYARELLPSENIKRITQLISSIEQIDDIRCFIPLLLSQGASS